MKERELNSSLRSQPAKVDDSRRTKVGDAGLDWHRRAYERCKQQAKEENRSLNEIVSERYGVCALYTFIFENQSVEFFSQWKN
mgnify:CR=1 FL=1